MVYFVIDQKWIGHDVRSHGKVIEISDDGESGIVEIVDENGNKEIFRGTAEAFQLLPDKWRVVT